jgi:YHS domain-containing protein
LAAALWSGGISFGGVIAFIFADLIAMPLILIYRKFYGWRLTLRVVALFYVVMTIAGLATEGIFRATRAIPSHRAFGVSTGHFSWNYTTYLNIIFIVIALGVTWFARNRARFGGGEGYAIDPVCAMQVRVADAPAQTVHHDTTVYFCSDRCRERYDADPERFSNEHPEAHSATPMVHADDTEHQASAEHEGFEEEGDEDSATDPVCGMTVQPAMAAAHRVHEGRDFWFCGVGCAEQFDANEERYTLLA